MCVRQYYYYRCTRVLVSGILALGRQARSLLVRARHAIRRQAPEPCSRVAAEDARHKLTWWGVPGYLFVVQNLIREHEHTALRIPISWNLAFCFSSSSSGVSVFAIIGGRRIRHPRAPRPRPGTAACLRTLRAGASSAAAAAAGRCAATCRAGSAHNLGWSGEESSAALL